MGSPRTRPSRTQTPAYRAMLERLREARHAAGLRQVEVAERLGKPQSWMSKVEIGERLLDPVELAELAALYGKPLAYFVGGS